MARARNTGMRVFRGVFLIDRGHAPILLEPVRARIRFSRRKDPGRVILLDHNGVPTGQTRPLTNGTFEIDGARDRTPYYLVRFGT